MYNIYLKYKSQGLFVIKLLVVSLAFAIIMRKVDDSVLTQTELIFSLLTTNLAISLFFLGFVLALSLINWCLDIFKWQLLVKQITPITFNHSAQQTFTAQTASLLTPNRIGEYGVKALYYPKKIRKKIVGLIFINHTAQMMATCFYGCIGLILLGIDHFLNINYQYITYMIIPVVFLILIIFKFKRELFIFKMIHWLTQLISVKVHIKNIILSILKYLVFTHQFYLLLMLFPIQMDYLEAMYAIFSIYFIASVIPSFIAFDWLIKGSVAVTIFGFLGVSDVYILGITSMMWLLNFGLPAAIGGFFLISSKKPAYWSPEIIKT